MSRLSFARVFRRLTIAKDAQAFEVTSAAFVRRHSLQSPSAVQNAVSSKALTTLYGTLALLFVLSAALLVAIGENMMFFITLAFATAGLILWRLTSLKVWLLAAIAAILLHVFSFIYALAMALTIGALGAYALIALLDLMVLIPLADLYMMSPKKK